MRNNARVRLAYRVALSAAGFILSFGTAVASEGDAYRGAEFLEKQGCVTCHAVKGQGGHSAPDLGSRIARQYTPASMASVMWNHAPAMWSAMAVQGVTRPKLDTRDAGDLFAYFYSVRFFERPGEAERGKHLLVVNHCVECHALTAGGPAIGKPVYEWTSVADPVSLAEQMWNHSSNMIKAVASKKFTWIMLSGQDLTDISVFVQNLPQLKPHTENFWLPSAGEGLALFQSKGCAECHKGARSLEHKLSNQSLTDIAAAMWNHAPGMTGAPHLSTGEMRQILSYVWATQYAGAKGDAGRGKSAFEKKRCAACHDSASSGAPHLGGAGSVYSPTAMVAVLWKHGPAMLEEMKKKDIPWPHLSAADMADLTTYLNSRP
jgi:cytochrome c551/c552